MKTTDLATARAVPTSNSRVRPGSTKRGILIWDSTTQGTRVTGYKANRLRLGLTKKQRTKTKRLANP